MLTYFNAARTRFTTPSEVFKATLPMNPSVTMTSTVPLYRSRPSTLPTKFSGSCFISWKASRVSWLPLVSSSPIESSPTLGRRVPKMERK